MRLWLKWALLEGSNHRNINKMLVNQVLPTCQLQMGMTELARAVYGIRCPRNCSQPSLEAYFYFEIPEDHAICHFMGEVDETRHVWMKGDQAVLFLPNGLFTRPRLRTIIPLYGVWAVRTWITAIRTSL